MVIKLCRKSPMNVITAMLLIVIKRPQYSGLYRNGEAHRLKLLKESSVLSLSVNQAIMNHKI